MQFPVRGGRTARVAVQHGHELLPGHMAVRVPAVADPLGRRPGHTLLIGVPAAGVHAVQPGQHRRQHGAGHGVVGCEGVGGLPGEQLPGGGKVDSVPGPVAADIVEHLLIVPNAHRSAVGEADGHLPPGEERSFEDGLRAVAVDEAGHGGGVISRNGDFDPYRPGGAGVDGDGGVLPGQRRDGENHAARIRLCHLGGDSDGGLGAVLVLLNGGGEAAGLFHRGFSGSVWPGHGLDGGAVFCRVGGGDSPVFFGFHHSLGAVCV